MRKTSHATMMRITTLQNLTDKNMCKFRTLRADEIEVRVQSVKNGKARHLLYINSRAVTNLLDETVGSFNWVSEFYEVCGRTICRIGIWDDKKEQFIYKSDTGSESNVEGDKGLISDCYKRCLSRWGVTELYTSPKIEMPDDGFGNGGYSVSEVTINEQRQITHLVLVDRFGKEAFRWDRSTPQISKTKQTAQPQEPTVQPQVGVPKKRVVNNNTLDNPEQCSKMLSLLLKECKKTLSEVEDGKAIIDFSPIITLRCLGFEIAEGCSERVAMLWTNFLKDQKI